MSDIKEKGASSPMEQIVRERQTEEKIRSLDACEVVAWIHDLEDRIQALEAAQGEHQ